MSDEQRASVRSDDVPQLRRKRHRPVVLDHVDDQSVVYIRDLPDKVTINFVSLPGDPPIPPFVVETRYPEDLDPEKPA